MAEEIKDLIEKIQQEGIQVAEEKAKGIEEQARLQTEEILKQAKSEAERLMLEAKERVTKMEEASGLSLKQAGRDLLIALRKEINTLLDKVILSAVQEALTPQELVRIISTLIKDYGHKDKEGIIISLKKEDLNNLEKGLFSELKEEVKKGIVLKAQEDISGGLVISFDKGKSYFDFSAQALAEYLAQYLKPKLAEIIKSD